MSCLVKLTRLVAAWAQGSYRKVPTKTVLSAVAAFLYFVNPFDVVPNVIPWVGYVDDAAVIAFVAASIRSDLNAFRRWEQRRKIVRMKLSAFGGMSCPCGAGTQTGSLHLLIFLVYTVAEQGGLA